MWLKYRVHDSERFRVWTPEQAQYGQFQILTKAELDIVIEACRLMSYSCTQADDD